MRRELIDWKDAVARCADFGIWTAIGGNFARALDTRIVSMNEPTSPTLIVSWREHVTATACAFNHPIDYNGCGNGGLEWGEVVTSGALDCLDKRFVIVNQ